MKVIEKGTAKDRWSMEVKCDGKGNDSENAKARVSPCGSRLEFGLTDIFVTTSYCGMDNSSTDYFTIKCPECGCLTDIPSEKIPAELESYAYSNPKQKAGMPASSVAQASGISIMSAVDALSASKEAEKAKESQSPKADEIAKIKREIEDCVKRGETWARFLAPAILSSELVRYLESAGYVVEFKENSDGSFDKFVRWSNAKDSTQEQNRKVGKFAFPGEPKVGKFAFPGESKNRNKADQ